MSEENTITPTERKAVTAAFIDFIAEEMKEAGVINLALVYEDEFGEIAVSHISDSDTQTLGLLVSGQHLVASVAFASEEEL